MTSVDPIALELFRTQIAAVAEEGFQTIVRTATSSVVNEQLDCTCCIMDTGGRLLSPGGQVAYHFWTASSNVKSIIARHGDTLAPGDVFIANDPHADASNHPQDVMVTRPIFQGDRLVGWVANGAHMLDIGGMVFGSYANEAHECYQEALRFPPVRLFRQGVEQTDILTFIRTNVRLPDQLEMDVRGMTAGCHTAGLKLLSLIDRLGGPDAFEALTEGLHTAVAAEMSRRLAVLQPGRYRSKSWVEWGSELYEVPCELSVDAGRLVFDFSGASPQSPHLFNSKPWIVLGNLAPFVRHQFARDLPLCHAVYTSIEVLCPPRSILNCESPAPIGAAHVDACGAAVTAAVSCLNLALAATYHPHELETRAASLGVSTAMNVWRYDTNSGAADGVLIMDGVRLGAPASTTRDGADFIDTGGYVSELVNVEVFETQNPMLILSKTRDCERVGAGRTRGGAGIHYRMQPHGVDKIIGTMLGKKPSLPIPGRGGGLPSSTTRFAITRPDGSTTDLPARAAEVELREGEVFEFWSVCGPGDGDPLDRATSAVLKDVKADYVTIEAARAIYGVVLNGDGMDAAQTEALRSQLRRERLARAVAPVRPCAAQVPEGGERLPLYPGIVQVGGVAVSEASGAALAEAPDVWTDGCATITAVVETEIGPVATVSYLEPNTGVCLLVDVRPAQAPLPLCSLPLRWTTTATRSGKKLERAPSSASGG